MLMSVRARGTYLELRDFTPCQEGCLIIAPKLIPDLTVNMKQNLGRVGGGVQQSTANVPCDKRTEKSRRCFAIYQTARGSIFFFFDFSFYIFSNLSPSDPDRFSLTSLSSLSLFSLFNGSRALRENRRFAVKFK